jgi:hypothetical protein
LKVSLHEGSEEWLIINVGGLEIPFAKTSRVVYRKRDYIWPAAQEIPDLDRSSGDGYLELSLPTGVSTEQQELFEGILREWTQAEALPASGAASPVMAMQEHYPDHKVSPRTCSQHVIYQRTGAIVDGQ